MPAVHTWAWVQVFPLHRPHTVTDKCLVHAIGVTNRMLSAPSQCWAACITNTSSLPLPRDRIFADHRGLIAATDPARMYLSKMIDAKRQE